MHTLKTESSFLVVGGIAALSALTAVTGCTIMPPTSPAPAYPSGAAYPPPPPNADWAGQGPAPSPGSASAAGPATQGPAAPDNPRAVWHSYDATLQRSPQGTIVGQGGGAAASLEVYESLDDNGVRSGPLLDEFFASPHYEAFNKMDHYWTERHPAANRGYPYVGKSMIPRGGDENETAAPPPNGVLDLQMSPPQSDHLTVTAFIVPVNGPYVVYDLAARRVSSSGGTAVYTVLNATGTIVTSLQVGNNRAWARDPQLYALGPLHVGDRIYFGVGRDGDYAYDATEVSFSVALVSP